MVVYYFSGWMRMINIYYGDWINIKWVRKKEGGAQILSVPGVGSGGWVPIAGHCLNQCTMSLTNRWIILSYFLFHFHIFWFLKVKWNEVEIGKNMESVVGFGFRVFFWWLGPTGSFICTVHFLGPLFFFYTWLSLVFL